MNLNSISRETEKVGKDSTLFSGLEFPEHTQLVPSNTVNWTNFRVFICSWQISKLWLVTWVEWHLSCCAFQFCRVIWTEVHCVSLCATCCNEVLAYLSEKIHKHFVLGVQNPASQSRWILVPKHNREPRNPTLCRLWTEASTITSSYQNSQVRDLLHLNIRCLHLLHTLQFLIFQSTPAVVKNDWDIWVSLPHTWILLT